MMTALADNSDINMQEIIPKIEIRNMSHDHIEKIAFLERECYSNPWEKNSFRAVIDYENSLNLVALVEGEVVAYAIVGYVLDEADIMNIATMDKYRRRGVANKLLEQIIASLKNKGVKNLFLEVRESNTAAISLYNKKGFSAISKRKGYYNYPTEDAIVMKKEI